jgi:CHAT domain-containing protein
MPARLAAAVARATGDDAGMLARIVIDPIRRHIDDRDLVIVPTGLLATAPWAVLPGLRGRPVTVAPSATAWLGKPDPVAGSPRTVLVAGPGNRRGPAEVFQIARRRPGATVLTGGAASPAATLAAIDGAGVAHLATHGRHEAQNALFSSLELAGGPILGYDLQRLAAPPELVVLAGCELGLSEVRPGDESFGMASALLAAGTATVIASVCRVADDVASEAMIGLHGRLAAGRTPAEALAAVSGGTGFICLGR